MRAVRILVVQGSLGSPSRTAALAGLATETLTEWGHDTEVFDLRHHDLPWTEPAPRDGVLSGAGASARQLVRAAGEADAFVWASPVYHNSFSGVLKCALDHLSRTEVGDKPVALCGDGGRRGSEQPLEHLRTVARSLHAVATPSVVTTRTEDFALRDGRYAVSNPEIVTRTRQLCHQLVAFADLLRRGHGTAAAAVEFLEEVL
ncbi:NADPH-dependent FMN reductase [Streptomyces sp. NPDC053542]|uniref:NADPH-dependent FMN reductase n=1 Tax=Streptomyces sp. NPDC053542 TaxID=3365710 RepID=UPI0037CE1C86